jgi:serine/threonine protein kinase
MSDNGQHDATPIPDRERRLDEIITAYLKAAEAGQAPDREKLLECYPELAAELRLFFADQDALEPIATPLRMVALAARAADAPASASGAAPGEGAVPGRLGDFQIMREIGRGGMGVVYEAEQVSLGRKVALKVLPALATLDPRRLQRFHNEARAAASLHHTNIVPVFAVGAEHGVHFYAMQLIDGQSLAGVLGELRRQASAKAGEPAADAPERDGEATTAHPPPEAAAAAPSTAPQAALSTEGGISKRDYLQAVARLGVQAAEALDYAHQLGVVHRDIKPGNLMVDGRGQLWVTDFGLAQLSEGGQSLTLTGDLVGTVRYMSPEQALAQRVVIDHRTDVYSLGATLYELLTLRPVFGGDSREELLRQIAFEEPRPLRKLNKAIPAELETIILKAVEKNPAERYATAQELADDLKRFLEDKPIQARRPSLVQRVRKWTRRHRALVTAVTAVAVLTLLGSALSTVLIWQAYEEEAAQRELAQTAEVKERAQRRLAERREAEADRARRKATAEQARAEANERQAKAERAQAEQERQIAQAVRHFLQKKLLRQASPWMQGDALLRTDGASADAKLDPTIGELLDRAAAELAPERIEAQFPNQPLVQAAILDTIGFTYWGIGRYEPAIAHLRRAHDLYQGRFGPDHPQTLITLTSLAVTYQSAGRYPDAIRFYAQLRDKRIATLGPDHPETLRTLSNLGAAYWAAGKLAEAIPLLQQVRDKQSIKLGADHPNTLYTLNNLALAYQAAGRLREALPLLEQLREKGIATFSPNHPETLTALHNLAVAYQAAGRLPEAIRLFEQVRDKRVATLGPDHPHTLATLHELAGSYRAVGRLPDAIRLLEQVRLKQIATLGPDHPDTLATMNGLAATYWSAGMLDRSVPLFEELVPEYKAKLGPSHPDTLKVMANLGVNYRDTDRPADALPLLLEVVDKVRHGPASVQKNLAWVAQELALTYEAAGQPAKAEPLHRDLLQQARQQLGADHPHTAGIMAELGLNLLAQKKHAEAEPVLRACLGVREKKLPDDWRTFNTKSILGGALLGQKKYTEAEPLLLQGFEGMKQREKLIPPHPLARGRIPEALERLVQLYEARGQKDQAAQWRQKLATARGQRKP